MTSSLSASNLSDQEIAAWIAFDQMQGIGLGAKRVMNLYEHLGTLEFALRANRDQLRFTPGMTPEIIDKLIERRKSVDPDDLLEKVRSEGMLAIPYGDQRYPYRLREIADPPCILYIKGRLSPDDLQFTAGVVGTRRPTSYGQRMAKEMASGLSRAGVTVVSGMAVGIDSFAHRSALEAGGRTIAVLGCGADVCYPSSNRPLYEMLVSGEYGAVVSEYFPGTKPETWRFPERNRIISGLSQALVVIEGGETSGSLITARMAFEQNREVFSVPGRVDSPMSAGPNSLIAKNMAQLVTGYKDVLDAMRWISAPSGNEVPNVVQLFGLEKDIFDLLTSEPMHFDRILEHTGMRAAELSAALTMLELAGVVERHTGDWYSKTS